HVYSEADIRLDEFVRDTLLQDLPDDAGRREFTTAEIVTFGAAAEAIYLAHMGLGSAQFAWENMDTRVTYHHIAMMSLAVVHAIHALRWNGMNEEADKIY